MRVGYIVLGVLGLLGLSGLLYRVTAQEIVGGPVGRTKSSHITYVTGRVGRQDRMQILGHKGRQDSFARIGFVLHTSCAERIGDSDSEK